MDEHKKYYKDLSEIADFIVLVLNKTILIINDKLIEHSTYPPWNEIIKYYTSLSTSINNLIGFDHTINYSRKSIIKSLPNAHTEYIKKKIDTIMDACIKFIDHTKLSLVCLDYFSKFLDTTRSSEGIKNLSDIYNLLQESLEKLSKKYLPKAEQLNNEILRSIKGGQSCSIIDDLKEFSIKGGFEESNCYQIIVGGKTKNKIVIGGFKADEYIKNIFIKYQLLKKDISSFNQNNIQQIEEYYSEFSHYLQRYVELSKMKIDEIFNDLVINCGLLYNLYQQFSKMIKVDLIKLLNYHSKRFDIKNKLITNFAFSDVDIIGEIIYEDEYGKIHLQLSWDPFNLSKSIKTLITGIKDIFNLIDKADINKILKDSKSIFKTISSINTVDDFNQSFEILNRDYDIISDKKFSFDARKLAKKNINNIMDDILDLSNQKIKLDKIIKAPFKHKKSTQKIDMEYLLDCMEYVINLESALIPSAEKYEIYSDKIAAELYNLETEINALISPENMLTCIKRPWLVITTGLTAVILAQLLNKRFAKEKGKENIEKLEKIIKLINEMTSKNINQFYDSNGLNLPAINDTISEIVGKIE